MWSPRAACATSFFWILTLFTTLIHAFKPAEIFRPGASYEAHSIGPHTGAAFIITSTPGASSSSCINHISRSLPPRSRFNSIPLPQSQKTTSFFPKDAPCRILEYLYPNPNIGTKPDFTSQPDHSITVHCRTTRLSPTSENVNLLLLLILRNAIRPGLKCLDNRAAEDVCTTLESARGASLNYCRPEGSPVGTGGGCTMQGWAALMVHDLCSKWYIAGGVEVEPPEGPSQNGNLPKLRKAEGYVSFRREGELGEWVDIFPNRACWYCSIL